MPERKKGIPKRKQPLPWPLAMKIAFSIDWRGDDENILTFVFLGATGPILKECFDLLCLGGYIMKGYKLEMEHACCCRNGHSYYRWAVTTCGYNTHFLSLENLCFLVSVRIRDQGHFVTFEPNYNKFLNL